MLDLIEQQIITDLVIYIREANAIYEKEETDSTVSQQDHCKNVLKRYVLEEQLFFLIGMKQFVFLWFQAGSVFASIFHTGSFSPYMIPAYHRSTMFVFADRGQYPLHSRVAATIHRAMGCNLKYVVTEISASKNHSYQLAGYMVMHYLAKYVAKAE